MVNFYGMGRLDAGYSMMNTANAQLSMMNSAGNMGDMAALHRMDVQNALNMQQDQLTYMMMEKMEDMQEQINRDKFKR